MNYQRRQGPLDNIPPVTKNILILNIVVFVLAYVGEATSRYDLKMLALYHPLSDYFRPYQLVSYMFMHGGFMHILFNMWAVVLFGKLLEGIWGGKKFFIYYFVTGIGAALFQIGIVYIRFSYLKNQLPDDILVKILTEGASILNSGKNFADPLFAKVNLLVNTSTVGASGAVFGVLMAFGMLFPEMQLMLMFPPIPIKGKYIAIFALVLGVLLDFRGNTAHFAHLGGMVFGYLLMKYWKNNTKLYQ